MRGSRCCLFYPVVNLTVTTPRPSGRQRLWKLEMTFLAPKRWPPSPRASLPGWVRAELWQRRLLSISKHELGRSCWCLFRQVHHIGLFVLGHVLSLLPCLEVHLSDNAPPCVWTFPDFFCDFRAAYCYHPNTAAVLLQRIDERCLVSSLHRKGTTPALIISMENVVRAWSCANPCEAWDRSHCSETWSSPWIWF